MKTVRGDNLEKIIENVAHMYKHQGKALIFKRPVEKSFTGGYNNKPVQVKYLAKAGVDFNGMLCGTGQFIAFEAKEIKTKTTKNFNLNLLQQHQFEFLKFVDTGGGVAFLLIHFADYERNVFFRVPVEYLENHMKGFKARQKKTGAKFRTVIECVGILDFDDMMDAGLELPKNKNNVYVDILGGLNNE